MQTIYLRVTDDLKKAIEKRAQHEGLSVNEFASHTLAEAAGEISEGLHFDIELTLRVLKGVAATPSATTITYGELASQHGHTWSWHVRNAIAAHLEDVWNACRQKGLPSLTSLVVAKSDGMPSAGFFRLERQSGLAIGNEAAFAAEQQAACRTWAIKTLGDDGTAIDPWPQLRGLWQGPDVGNFQDFMRGPPDETTLT